MFLACSPVDSTVTPGRAILIRMRSARAESADGF